MRYFAAFVLLILASAPFAGFTFIEAFNGSNQDELDDQHEFLQISGLLAADGKLYVTDSGKSALYVMNGSTRERYIGGLGTSVLDNPMKMAYDDGTLYIADGLGTFIKKYGGGGSEITKWNIGSNMKRPSSLAINGEFFYITDLDRMQVFVYSRSNRAYTSTAVDSGYSDGKLVAPVDIKFYGGQFFISDYSKGLLFVYDSNLTFLQSIGRGKEGITLSTPRGFDIYDGQIYVADSSQNRVVVFTMDGYPVEVLNSTTNPEGDFSYPEDVAVADGKLYVADTGNKLVKVFSINPTKGDDDVLALLASANESIAKLRTVEDAAKKLGILFGQSKADEYAAAAHADYSTFAFSSAASLARQAIGASATSQSALVSKIDISIKLILQSAQDAVKPYRGKVSGALSEKLVRVDNLVADSRGKLSAGNFGTAAVSALAASELANEFAPQAKSQMEAEESLRQNRTESQYSVRISVLRARLSDVKAKADLYQQPYDLSNSENLLSVAESALADGDYAGANHSMEFAEIEIGAYSSSLSQIIAEIDSVLSNLSVMEFEFNSTISKPMLIPADFSAQQAQMSQARESAYSNPQLALTMARQALSDAGDRMAGAQSLSVSATAFLAVAGLVALVAVAFYLHLVRRKKELGGGLAGGPQAKKRERKAGGR